MALIKYCNCSGSNKLALHGVLYCEAHTYSKAERHKEYKNCLNQTSKSFYNSSEWKLARAIALARDTRIDIYFYISQRARLCRLIWCITGANGRLFKAV